MSKTFIICNSVNILFPDSNIVTICSCHENIYFLLITFPESILRWIIFFYQIRITIRQIIEQNISQFVRTYLIKSLLCHDVFQDGADFLDAKLITEHLHIHVLHFQRLIFDGNGTNYILQFEEFRG